MAHAGSATCSRQTLAVLLILLVDVLWVSSSELTQSIFHNASYDHPYFLSYFNTSLFSVYALCFMRLFYHTLQRKMHSSSSLVSAHANGVDYHSVAVHHQHGNAPINKPPPITSNSHANASFSKASHSCCVSVLPPAQLSILSTFKLSTIFAMVWFSMTYTFNLSLRTTSVASNSIISSMSGPFSLALSRVFLHDYPFTMYNILGVAVTVSGTCLIAYLDSLKLEDRETSIGGDLLAIISALIYAIYVTALKYKIGDESRVNMFLFFGFIGLLNFTVLWPAIFILNSAGLETLIWPENNIWVLLLINGLLTIVGDYLWAQAILLSDPVLATVGLSLMMPLGIVADKIFRGITHGWLYYIGAICVWIGFVLVNIDRKNKGNASDRKQ